MRSILPLILLIILLTTSLSIAQNKDAGKAPLENREVRDSLVAAFLEMVYGELRPDIEKVLADSGAINNGTKAGNWNEYNYKPCVLCDHKPISYKAINKDIEENRDDIFFLKETGEYKNGKKQGTWRMYSTSRLEKPFEWELVSQVEYVNNNKEGWEHKFLMTADSIQYEYRKIYYQHGIENGPVYGFNAKGDTTLIGQNKNGLEHGLFKFRKHDLLTISFDRVYQNGEDLETIFYHANGVIESRGHLVDFLPHGIYRKYNEKGQLISEEGFRFGILQGESRFYYDDGQLKMVENFSEGNTNGSYRYYYENGQLWTELETKDGKAWTVKSNYDRNGKAKDKGTLKDGNGTVKRYDEKGKLIAIEHYKNGELTKEVNK